VCKWNDSAEKAFRLSSDDVLGLEFVDMGLPWDWTVVREAIEKCSADLQPVQVNNLGYTRPSGKDGFLLATINPIIGPNPGGERAIEGFLLLADDITEFKLLEVQLSQSQKLESIGQLAAGIAHEINTPIQYVGDSVVFLKSAFEDCQRVLGLVEELTASGACALPEDGAGTAAGTGAGCAGGLEGIRAGLEEIDFEFFKEEVPKSFVRVLDGVERVSTIVQAMKRFSHPGGVERKAVDINKAIENTLVVSRNEWKYVAEVETELAPDLPQVVCMPSDLNQVLLNVVVNAAHAIAEVVRNTQDRGLIRIATRQADGLVEIAVRDSGGGIPAAIQDKVFDPFFTTKEVGRGTGQGLAIAYDIVVKKHGGRIFFESGEGRGTTFFVQLPVAA
jgi:signal transduction histidine kinase